MRSPRLLAAVLVAASTLALAGPVSTARAGTPQVSAVATPAVAHVGSVVDVVGTVPSHPGAVTLERLVGRSWKTVTHGRTDARGHYTLPLLAPAHAATLTLRVVRSAASSSRSVRVVVVKAIFAVRAASPASVADGGPIVVTGTVTPKTSGTVWLQRLLAGTWHDIASSRLTAGSRFTVNALEPVGAYRIRVFMSYRAKIAGGVSKAMSVTVQAAVVPPGPPAVTTTTLPGGDVGFRYSAQLTAGGGTPPYTWSAAAGALPAGLTLTPAGVIGGAPSAAGTLTLSPTVTDAAGRSGSVALTVTVAHSGPRAWGLDETGELGNGTTTSTNVPAAVSGLPDVIAMAGGGSTGYAVRADGTVWAWGANDQGQLGDGSADTTDDILNPVEVTGLTGVTAIASGQFSAYALRSDGTVWGWGSDVYGQLGDGTVNTSNVPVQVAGLTQVAAIGAGGEDGYALKSDGTVWAWGLNSVGQLGNGVAGDAHQPVEVSVLSDVTAISGGSDTGYAVRSDGTVWAWGSGGNGQLGDDATTNSAVPVQVTGLDRATSVAGGGAAGYALRTDGSVWSWGANSHGELGDGNVSGSDVPVQVHFGFGTFVAPPMTSIAGAQADGYSVDATGAVWSWGYDANGQLGVLTPVSSLHIPFLSQSLTRTLAVSAGCTASAAFAIVPD